MHDTNDDRANNGRITPRADQENPLPFTNNLDEQDTHVRREKHHTRTTSRRHTTKGASNPQKYTGENNPQQPHNTGDKQEHKGDRPLATPIVSVESVDKLRGIPDPQAKKDLEAGREASSGTPLPLLQIRKFARFVSMHGYEEIPANEILRLRPFAVRLLQLLSASRRIDKEFAQLLYIGCPPEERELLFEWRPILKHHEGLRAFTQYLLHPPFEAEQGGILISREQVLSLFGFSTGVKVYGKAPRQYELLRLYMEAVCRIEVTNYSPRERIARTIKVSEYLADRLISPTDIPSRIIELADGFPSTLEPEKEHVNFMTGAEMSDDNRHRRRQVELRESEKISPVIPAPNRSVRFRDYMNRRDGGQYRSMRKNIDRAMAKAKDCLPIGPSRRASINTLRGLADMPNGVYAISDYSPRLKAFGTNQLMNLKSSLRRELYGPRHVELDLSKAQAAAAHYLWDGELNVLGSYLRAHMDNDIDLWDDLAASIDLPDTDAKRKCVKKGIYTVVFGGRKSTLFGEMRSEYEKQSGSTLKSCDAIRPFLKHPVVEELWEARETEFRRIEENGGRKDFDSRWLNLEDFNGKKNPVKSLLSYAAQSVEQFLMEPILIEAEKEEAAVLRGKKKRPLFQIVLYQSDGCTIQVYRKRDSLIRRVVDNLQKKVAKRAKQHGIITSLEVDHPSDWGS